MSYMAKFISVSIFMSLIVGGFMAMCIVNTIS